MKNRIWFIVCIDSSYYKDLKCKYLLKVTESTSWFLYRMNFFPHCPNCRSQKLDSMVSEKIRMHNKQSLFRKRKKMILSLGTNCNNSIILKEWSFPLHALPEASRHSVFCRSCDCPEVPRIKAQSTNGNPLIFGSHFFGAYFIIYKYPKDKSGPHLFLQSESHWLFWPPKPITRGGNGGRAYSSSKERKIPFPGCCSSPEDPFCKKGQVD